MCLAIIAIGQHPLYPLIILSNRDEFYARDSAQADFWHEYPNMFAGRDLIKNGSWLGINKSGQFALVTNYRDPRKFKPLKTSRGLLVSNYLSDYANKSPLEYIDSLKTSSDNYNKFNLIIGDVNNAYYYSNVTYEAKLLPSGIYGISNHLLDTPWPKVERAKKLFISLLPNLLKSNNIDKNQDNLFEILSDRALAPDDLLPQTGVPQDLEKSLSSIYVDVPLHKYGTTNSSVILFEKSNISFAEKIFKSGSFLTLQKTDITPFHPLVPFHNL